MKFKLAILAMATMVFPGIVCAQSAVTLYGIVDATVRYADNSPPTGDSLKSVGDGAWTGSRWGFRGSEDLGGGLKGIFNLEGGFDPSSGVTQQSTSTANFGQGVAPNGRLFGRAAYVGLSSGLGTLTIGRQQTLAHDMAGRFQPQSNPNQDSLSVFSGHHVSRQDNLVKYINKFGPFGIGLSATASEGNGRSWGASGQYAKGPIDVVAYAQNMRSFNGQETRKIYGLGGRYNITEGLKLYLGGMLRDHDESEQENKVYTAGVNFNLTEKLLLTASFTRDRQTGVDSGSRKVSWVSGDYAFSKRTDVYLVLDHNELSGSFPVPSFMGTRDNQTGVTAGLRHRF